MQSDADQRNVSCIWWGHYQCFSYILKSLCPTLGISFETFLKYRPERREFGNVVFSKLKNGQFHNTSVWTYLVLGLEKLRAFNSFALKWLKIWKLTCMSFIIYSNLLPKYTLWTSAVGVHLLGRCVLYSNRFLDPLILIDHNRKRMQHEYGSATDFKGFEALHGALLNIGDQLLCSDVHMEVE